MKNSILTFAAILIISLSACAQSTPVTPEPPKADGTTSYSISVHEDDNSMSNSSVSVTKSDDEYKFRASFHKSKTNRVKAVLLDRLGKGNLSVNGSVYLWTDSKSSDEVFECKLTKGKLRMYMDKELVSNSFYKKIEALGTDLKHLISGTNAKKMAAKDAKRAQQDLERAQRDVERAKKDLERAKERLAKKKN